MAESSTLARPYAKAAFEYAVESRDLDNWSEFLLLTAKVIQQAKVRQFLNDPGLTGSQQAESVLDICGEKFTTGCRNLIGILSENRRLGLLPQIRDLFEVMKANLEQAIEVSVVCSHKLDESQHNSISDALSERLKRRVNLRVSVDKNLLGGVIVRAGDTVFDGSIRGRLNKLAESLNS